MRRDLGVGLAEERRTAGAQLVAQLGEVLDDPVVDERQSTVLAEVRVGVHVVGSTVGGPAGVPDPDGGVRQRRMFER